MIERLQLEILKTVETPSMFRFVIRLTEGKLSFTDRFAWVKSEALAYTRSPILEGSKREKNRFTYDDIVQTAVHEFLRVTGRVDLSKGFAWQPFSFQLIKGNQALPLGLSQRASQMLGAQLSLDEELPMEVRQAGSPPGDVYTISDDADDTVYWEPDAWFKGTSAWGLAMGYRFTGAPYQIDRMFCRFPLSTLPSGVAVVSADFKNKCVTAGGATATWDVHPYNGDGQADPVADAAATCATRIIAGTPYLNDLSDWRSTGVYTLHLPDTANIDIMSAKGAVDRFSLGGHQEDETLVSVAWLEQLEAVGTDEPKLIVTHSIRGPFPTFFRQ